MKTTISILLCVLALAVLAGQSTHQIVKGYAGSGVTIDVNAFENPTNVYAPCTVLSQGGTIALVGNATAGTAYFVYFGRTIAELQFKRIAVHCSSAGSGTQTNEWGLFSSPLPPQQNLAGQTLTRLAAVGDVGTYFTSTGVKTNTDPLNCTVPAGTHLWVGFRMNTTSGMPTVTAVTGDCERGAILTLGAASLLTNASTFAATNPLSATTGVAPNFRLMTY